MVEIEKVMTPAPQLLKEAGTTSHPPCLLAPFHRTRFTLFIHAHTTAAILPACRRLEFFFSFSSVLGTSTHIIYLPPYSVLRLVSAFSSSPTPL